MGPMLKARAAGPSVGRKSLPPLLQVLRPPHLTRRRLCFLHLCRLLHQLDPMIPTFSLRNPWKPVYLRPPPLQESFNARHLDVARHALHLTASVNYAGNTALVAAAAALVEVQPLFKLTLTG